MFWRRAFLIAACMVCTAAGPAFAQFPPTQQQAPGASPWDQPAQSPQQSPQSPWAQPQQQPQQQAVEACVKEFTTLRDTAQKRANAIRIASERKAPAKEACALFNSFSDSEVKLIKYAADNATRCNIPPEVGATLKQGHAKTTEMRNRVCSAASAPAQNLAPSLSDALSAPVPNANNIKTGRGTGTYDSLTGTPLGK